MTTRGPVRWRQREASRAVWAVQQAGLTVDRIEVSTDGKISVYTAKGAQEAPEIGVAKNAADVVAERLR